MTDDDYAQKLNEADRLLNDPDVPLLPALIWRLLAEEAEHRLRDSTVLSHVTDLAPKLCPEKAPSDQRYNVGA